MASSSTLPRELEAEIAEARNELKKARTLGDPELVKLCLADLTELRKKENLLLQQQQPGNIDSGEPSSKRLKLDRSAEYAGALMPAQPVQLPRAKDSLTEILFPEASTQRIPVTAEYYDKQFLSDQQLTAKYLYSTDGSSLPNSMTFLLDQPVEFGSTEMDTSVPVATQLKAVFRQLQAHSDLKLSFVVLLNSTEKRHQSSQKTVKAQVRPDTMVTVSNCTLLLGEDKWQDLKAAIDDLKAKRKDQPLSSMHYGDVPFLLGYAAAGSKFQWLWLSADGRQVGEVGAALDLMVMKHRYMFLLSLVNVYYLLDTMAQTVPALSGRLPLYSEILREDGRSIIILANGAKKIIPKFLNFCQSHATSFKLIEKAYSVAAQVATEPPFLLCAESPPTVSHGRFEVTTKPGGYPSACISEKDLRLLAAACCKSAQALHTNGLVYRDFRIDNIVQLDPEHWMVIDLESVGDATGRKVPVEWFNGWDEGTLDQGRFTAMSDMYQIGKLLEIQGGTFSCGLSAEAVSFVEQLESKQLSAEAALAHPWFQ